MTVTTSSNYAIGSVSLVAAAPFSISQNTCTGEPGRGRQLHRLGRLSAQRRRLRIRIAHGHSAAVASPATVALSGTGFDFTVAISGPASQTVARGQQANYTLVISPTGSSGTFTFSCGTLPANALCLFSPATESLSAGVQGNVVVEISTGNDRRLVSKDRYCSRGEARTAFQLWRALPLACGLLLLPLAVRRRRKFFLLAVLAVFLRWQCFQLHQLRRRVRQGSSGQSGGSGTPPGTYTIPVTVTSMGVSQSVNLTLTVD